jgi:hypothetical protein
MVFREDEFCFILASLLWVVNVCKKIFYLKLIYFVTNCRQ